MGSSIAGELRKFVAPEFIFGNGSRHIVDQYAANLGMSRVLLVTDPGVTSNGWATDVKSALDKAGFFSTIYSSVSPNPRDHEVMAGVKHFNEAECDSIIAIGGGSPMDCAKGISVVVANGGNILDYEGVDTIDEPGPPLICIPTTSGTAADVSQFAIITDVEAKNKIAIISKAIVPDVSLIDPETTTSMDPYLSACTGLDALTHAVEAYVSNAHSPITDLHALKAIELVTQWLPVVHKDPTNLLAREQMALASLEAGLAFSNASLGAVHAMAHSLGGYLDLPHGECNAILLNHIMAFNSSISPERFQKIGSYFNLDFRGMTDKQIHLRLLEAVYQFRASLGVERSLGAIGVRTADIPDLAKHAFVDPCLVTNPRKAVLRDIEVLYEEAL